MHYIHKVGCTSVRQVPVTGTCSFRLTTQIWRDLCLSETQIPRSSDLCVSHGYTCVDPQVTQTCAQPYVDESENSLSSMLPSGKSSGNQPNSDNVLSSIKIDIKSIISIRITCYQLKVDKARWEWQKPSRSTDWWVL